jgi:hypothetical protein
MARTPEVAWPSPVSHRFQEEVPGPITDRQFEIEFLDPGVEAFVFTSG